jgi:hypothetical protein
MMPQVYENDIFVTGIISALKMMLEIKAEGKTLDKIDFEYLIEREKRNLNDPTMLDYVEILPVGGE